MKRTTKTSLQYVTLALSLAVLATAFFLSFVFPRPASRLDDPRGRRRGVAWA